jgi:hypothetical protein
VLNIQQSVRGLYLVYEFGENWARHAKVDAFILALPVIRVKVKRERYQFVEQLIRTRFSSNWPLQYFRYSLVAII